MNFRSITFNYVLVFITALVLSILQVPFWLIMLIVFIIIIVPFILLQLHAVYWTNDLKKVEKFLKANRKKPLLAFPFALAHSNHVEVEESLHAILTRHKQPLMQQVYSTVLDLFHKDYEAARASAGQISKESLRSYYLAYSAAKLGDLKEAKRYMQTFDKPWMYHAMNSLIACQEGDDARFAVEHQKAIDASRGIQKYSVVHSHNHL
jgi:Ca2+/Na+ antiporter